MVNLLNWLIYTIIEEETKQKSKHATNRNKTQIIIITNCIIVLIIHRRKHIVARVQ